MPSVTHQEDAYKRGVVLGLTMAEIVLLILFTLLLVLAALVAAKERERTGLMQQLEAVRRDFVTLADRRVADPDAFFRELVLAEDRARETAQLRERLAEAGRETRELREALEREKAARATAEASAGIVKRYGNAAPEVLKAFEESGLMTAASEDRRQFVEAIRGLGAIARQSGRPPDEMVRRVVAEAPARERENQRLRGELRNIDDRLKRMGLGTEKPSCWADPDTGKVEYIFDIRLTGRGLVIRDRASPQRAEDRKQLPIAAIPFETELSQRAFLAATEPLFAWGEKENCRFFVRAFDGTGATEKGLYKALMRTVEGHFYKLEVVGGSF